jgi:SpoVK/Ycf46/Vps4 family AAA+-type ATPase
MSDILNDFKILEKSKIFPADLLKDIEKDLKLYYDKEEKQATEIQEQPVHIDFNFDMVNSDKDLKDLITKLKKSKSKQYSLLLYGEPGSGKSYFGKYLAQELGMSVIKKRASDLMDRWVGATEKNIKDAFNEAKEKNAILIFDEADSFLFNRKNSKQEYTVAQVNEMLTQMEDHPLPFICTTNLKEGLDPASFRRFIFKIKYNYMNSNNIKAGIKEYFNKDVSLDDINNKELQYITAGDFVTTKKKLDILENGKYKSNIILQYLREEQDEKNIKIIRKIGL